MVAQRPYVVVLSLICEGDLVFDLSTRGPLFCVLYRCRCLLVVVGCLVVPPKPPPIPRSAPNITALLQIDSAYSIALLEPYKGTTRLLPACTSKS